MVNFLLVALIKGNSLGLLIQVIIALYIYICKCVWFCLHLHKTGFHLSIRVTEV